MIAVTRKEKILDAIVNSGDIDFEPVTREELFLVHILDSSVVIPTPVTRLEKLYKAVADGDDLDFIPIERLELFVAQAAGIEVPPIIPVTREEFYWSQIEGGAGTWTTLQGTSPLSLVNAVQGKLKKLVQFGKVSVNDGVITCNNGVLTLVDDELPLEFKRITGMKFDGDTWYDTEEVLTGDDDVTLTLANTASGGQNVFGSYNGTSAGTKNFSLFIYGGGSSSNSYFRYGEQLARPKFGSNERTITIGKSGTTGFTTDVSVTPETFTTEATAYIGMLPNSTSAAYTGSIIGNILVGTRLKYIPCERIADGVVGYYETHTETFIEPSGTGSVTKGEYDTSHCTVIIVEGTAEEVTVTRSDSTTETVSDIPNLYAVDSICDEHDIITGRTIRRTEAVVESGAIVIQPLATPVEEQYTPHAISVEDGTNTVEWTAEVEGMEMEVIYKAEESNVDAEQQEE